MAILGRATTAAQGWVLYDGQCSLCNQWARHGEALLHRHGFELAPLQTGWVSARFGLNPSARPAEMLVLLPDGHALGGADGLVQIARRIWWAWPLFALAQLPGMLPVFRVVYRHVAARRNCREGACELLPGRQVGDWTMLLALPVLVLLTRDFFSAWFFMWLLAGALYFGCKWLTWRRGMRQVGEVGRLLFCGYLFGWVGMDAKKFFTPTNLDFKPKWNDCLSAVVKVLVGVALIWLGVRHLVAARPLLAGWVGMFGLILCLHFGLFQLLALAWQRAGVNAPPLMREPLRAVSLADFWGRRWNRAFHYLANDLAFRPLAGRVGAAGAMFIVFLLSGLVHDLIISVPARGGYGLPTTYFLIQGLGVLFERTPMARRIGLGRGWRGWLFTVICAAVPAYWLFPPIFIHHVILPMLHAFGAT